MGRLSSRFTTLTFVLIFSLSIVSSGCTALGPIKKVEGLKKEQVGDVLHSMHKEVEDCLKVASISLGDWVGTYQVYIDFNITASGLVDRAEIQHTFPREGTPDPKFDSCVLEMVRRAKFDKPKGGTNVHVTYPFRLTGAVSWVNDSKGPTSWHKVHE